MMKINGMTLVRVFRKKREQDEYPILFFLLPRHGKLVKTICHLPPGFERDNFGRSSELFNKHACCLRGQVFFAGSTIDVHGGRAIEDVTPEASTFLFNRSLVIIVIAQSMESSIIPLKARTGFEVILPCYRYTIVPYRC